MLQQIVYLVSKGYIYYHVGEIPLNKANKAKNIDTKIIEKYNIDLSKDQRRRRKQKGLANYYYLRWKNQFVILHTDGKRDAEDDKFHNIKTYKGSDERLRIAIGSKLSLDVVNRNNSITVVLDRLTYLEMKGDIDELVKYKKIKALHEYFKRLNSIPAWSGIVQQKFELQHEVYRLAKKYNLNTKSKNIIKYPYEYGGLVKYPMWINTYRKPVNRDFTNKNITEWL